MRICFIADPKSIHIQRWARYLTNRSHEVVILSRGEGSFDSVKLIDPFLREDSFISNIPWIYGIINLTRFRLAIRKLKPDIVHIHFISARHFVDLLFYIGIKNLTVSSWGSDVIWDCEEKEPFKRRFCISAILRLAKVITTTTHFLADVTRRYTPKGRKIHVIPFGVDCEIFHPVRKRGGIDRPVTLGFIKPNLKPIYGPEYLIQAMKLIVARFPSARLLMVGSGALETGLKEMARNMGLNNNIVFKGEIPYSEVPLILEQVDIFVMPSVREAFGVVAIEAEAMEIPVVATKVGGISEAVVDGETGILVEPRNPQQLAEAIITLIEDLELRFEMGRRGREFVLANYRWEDNAKMMEDIYFRMIRG